MDLIQENMAQEKHNFDRLQKLVEDQQEQLQNIPELLFKRAETTIERVPPSSSLIENCDSDDEFVNKFQRFDSKDAKMPLNNPQYFDQPQRRTGIPKTASVIKKEDSDNGEDGKDLFQSFHQGD